tara:strand:- start:29 stop:892 length:864 start_codon:yes stop_codon:yes gene_type:complete
MTKIEQSCATCIGFSIDKVVKSQSNMKPSWLANDNRVTRFITNNGFKQRKPSNIDVKLNVNIGTGLKGRKVLYWATKRKETMSPMILDSNKAYHNFENSGVTSISRDGTIMFSFECPQLYSTKHSAQKSQQTYFRHLHFVISNEKCNEWSPEIYTKIVVCQYGLKKMLQFCQSKMHVIINTLPHDSFAKDHIPNSYNLSYKTIKSMSVDELKSWFCEVVKLHYPKLNTYLLKERIEPYQIPIITYCAHSECNVSQLAIQELMKKGFVNISEYSGGMREYRSKIPFDK